MLGIMLFSYIVVLCKNAIVYFLFFVIVINYWYSYITELNFIRINVFFFNPGA